jgi:hypothetical protein
MDNAEMLDPAKERRFLAPMQAAVFEEAGFLPTLSITKV